MSTCTGRLLTTFDLRSPLSVVPSAGSCPSASTVTRSTPRSDSMSPTRYTHRLSTHFAIWPQSFRFHRSQLVFCESMSTQQVYKPSYLLHIWSDQTSTRIYCKFRSISRHMNSLTCLSILNTFPALFMGSLAINTLFSETLMLVKWLCFFLTLRGLCIQCRDRWSWWEWHDSKIICIWEAVHSHVQSIFGRSVHHAYVTLSQYIHLGHPPFHSNAFSHNIKPIFN